MLSDALELERSHKRFGDAVLLSRVRKNEPLMFLDLYGERWPDGISELEDCVEGAHTFAFGRVALAEFLAYRF
jgi:hypothetical protein